jgi:WD40 repeat protein
VEVATGRPLLAPLQGHRDVIRSVAFSPDSSLLASAGDMRPSFSGRCRAASSSVPLHVHSDSVRDLAFSPDGKWLVSAGLDKQVVAWSLERLAGEGVIARFNAGQSLKALCDKVAENLSAAEWSRYAGPGVPYVVQCPDKLRPS